MSLPVTPHWHFKLTLFFNINSEYIIPRHLLIDLKKKYKALDGAEAALGISVETYIDGSPNLPSEPSLSTDDLNLSPQTGQQGANYRYSENLTMPKAIYKMYSVLLLVGPGRLNQLQ